MKNIHFFLGLSLLSASLGGCSSKKSVSEETLAVESGPTENPLEEFDLTLPKEESKNTPQLKNHKMKPFAFSKDGFPKVKKYFLIGSSDKKEILQRTEYDFNGDGRVDFIQFFHPEEQYVTSESSDLDGDGTLEITSFYEKSLTQKEARIVKQEISTLASNATNVWKYFENSQLIRREIDRKGRGRPDYWEYYNGARLSRIDRDEDGDGNPDSNPEFRKVVNPSTPDPLAN